MDKQQNWEEYGLKVTSIYPSESLIRFYMKYLYNLSNPKTLELGCGGGRNSNFLAQHTEQLTAIDCSKNAIRKARGLLQRNKLVAELVLSDITNFQFEKNTFDAVIDVSTLQHFHINDLKIILPKIHSSLKETGYFFSIFKNKDDFTYLEGEKLNENTKKYQIAFDKISNPCILTFLSKMDVEHLFSQFNVVEINEERWTYNDSSRLNSHWLLTLQK